MIKPRFDNATHHYFGKHLYPYSIRVFPGTPEISRAISKWLSNTLEHPTDFRMWPNNTYYDIHFREEKFLTMLLLKWS